MDSLLSFTLTCLFLLYSAYSTSSVIICEYYIVYLCYWRRYSFLGISVGYVSMMDPLLSLFFISILVCLFYECTFIYILSIGARR